MAISWSTAQCNPPEPRDETESVNREVLILIGANLEAGDLTEETVREWFVRFRIHERTCVVPPNGFFRDASLVDVLRRWIGLRVNAGNSHRSAWLARQFAGAIDDAENEFDEDFDAATCEAAAIAS